jgi:hypothetical protein
VSKSGSGGGGYGSKPHVSKPMRQGQQRERIRHAGVAQIGQAQGNHFTGRGGDASGYGGVNFSTNKTGYPSQLGNELTTPNGPKGQGRTVHRSGSQQGLTSARPLPKGRDILGEFK